MTTNLRNRQRRDYPRHRRGTFIILSALLSIVLMAMVAFAVDVGYVLSTKEELQRTADSAALAACWEYSKQLSDGASSPDAVAGAEQSAGTFAGLNDVGGQSPALSSAGGDVTFGYINDLYDPNAVWDTSGTNPYNVVQVRVRRDASINGEVPLFFARVFGLYSKSLQAEARAAMVQDVWGFQVPSDGGNLGILPIALDLDTLLTLLAGQTDDEWVWTDEKTIEPGEDGFLEVNLYPQGTGAPGNRGMVDIGSSNNSTSDIARQIIDGLSPSDMEYHGGKLEFDSNGELFFNGDTGISAGVKDELASIKGEPRTIPIFREVNGPGNNAQYTIVQWLGVRIMDVKLSGPESKKRVTIQVAPMVSRGVIPSTTQGTSHFVYSPAVLLQ